MKHLSNALRIAAIAAILGIGLLAWYTTRVELAYHARPLVVGTLTVPGLLAPITIRRDSRGVPHIEAANEHDLFFAQGFAEGQDRLFQLDLLRRAVYGRLSEVFGKATLGIDENARNFDVRGMVARQWRVLTPQEQTNVRAFASGVNAAAQDSPTPVEFRIGLYSFEPWTPQDSLAVGMATVIDLTDTWNDIAPRDFAEGATNYNRKYPLTDPCFDAPVTDGLTKIGPGEHCPNAVATMLRELKNDRSTFASNEWAAGAYHTRTHRALLANDPHLRLMIPGVWYLADLRAPGFHAAGATLAGTPGIILGHSAYVAWGATNGTVASMSIYRAGPLSPDDAHMVTENFRVRFGGVVTKKYYRDPQNGIFGATANTWAQDPLSGPRIHWIHPVFLVRWPAYAHPQSPLPAFDALDRARSMADALAALRAYPGPTQNFVLADTSGRVAYQLAGDIPNDPLWARGIHRASEIGQTFANVPFDKLPRVTPSRNTIAWTANNKMYGPEYQLRLSPQFAPPYRAYRIAQLLRARKTYDVAYFTSMQMDTHSVLERDLARAPAFDEILRQLSKHPISQDALEHWDGNISGSSTIAPPVVAIRRYLVASEGAARARMDTDDPSTSFVLSTMQGLQFQVKAGHEKFPRLNEPWSKFGAVPVQHAFASLGIPWLNGTTFAGKGDAFTVHMQKHGFSQSFRAVWDVGNWDAGGVTLPQGESGRPGSAHYTDEASPWVAGTLLPLPFTTASVLEAAKETLVLRPRTVRV
ncbi:MAG: penicillin acylase family protein [Vulcanimicrobiaceae bacterium]